VYKVTIIPEIAGDRIQEFVGRSFILGSSIVTNVNVSKHHGIEYSFPITCYSYVVTDECAMLMKLKLGDSIFDMIKVDSVSETESHIADLIRKGVETGWQD
jgi:hypothetical protein